MSYDYNMGLSDLNKAVIATDADGNTGRTGLEDYGIGRLEHGIAVHFRDLAPALVEYIHAADLIVGCIAWLTHQTILEALATVPSGVALVVQKEDFLRPDMPGDFKGTRTSWGQQLRKRYGQLPWGPLRYVYPSPLSDCSILGDPGLEPVRCVGNFNEDKSPAFPRMHHKFLVFCRQRYLSAPYCGEDGFQAYAPYPMVEPFAVWTGSFNLTENATHSLENALYITIPDLVHAYYHEWAQIEAMSEPLDWEHVWCTPEWRIGT